MLIPAGDPYYYICTGTWGVSDTVRGHEKGSHFTSTDKAKYTYTPYMPAGKYKVEFFNRNGWSSILRTDCERKCANK